MTVSRLLLVIAALSLNSAFAQSSGRQDLENLDTGAAQTAPPMNLQAVAQTPPAPRPIGAAPSVESPNGVINAQPAEIAKWQEYFDLVIVVNKAETAETIQVFKKGEAQPVLNSRVSTGTEEYVCHAIRDRQTGFVTSVRKIYTETPAGYYVAGNADIDHFSGAFDDAHMPYAIFMKDPTGAAEGIATHQAPLGTEKLIGNRASHGCMRLRKADAQFVFSSVLRTGAPLNLDGDEGLNAQCNPAVGGVDPTQCPADVASREPIYRKWLLAAGIIGSTYPSRPLVPVVKRDGTLSDGQGHSFTLDTVNGRAKMVPGFKTLYIIESVETGTPTNRIVTGFDKNGKPVTRPAQKSDITCPTPDDINHQEGRQPPQQSQSQWPWQQSQPQQPGQPNQGGFDCHKGIFGCIFGGN